jgi:Domain of unknown function (DUF5007)
MALSKLKIYTDMKKIVISSVYSAMMLLVIVSCTPPDVGFLSSDIHSLQDTLFVPRGVFRISATPSVEGSTFPMHWQLAGVTNADGKSTNELLEEHEILTWKEAYNHDTDTTLAQAQAKLELTKRPSMLINDATGQLVFTQASRQIQNDVFKVSVVASNLRGKRQMNDFVTVKLEKFKAVEFPVEMRSRLRIVKNTGGVDALYTATIQNDFDEGVPSVLDGTHPYITVVKVSDEPTLAVKVNMTIADSYGEPLNPAKIVFFPSGSTYLQNYHDNSTETVVGPTSTTFNLPAPPFPQFARTYTGESAYLMYYLSTTNALIVDKAAYEADNGPKDWSAYTDPRTGEINNNAYVRWGIKINDTGTWNIKMKIPYSIVRH